MKFKTVSVTCTAFTTGFALMGIEMLASRMMSPFFGNNIYVWGALISVLLAGLSIGYAVGGWLTHSRTSQQKLLFRILIISGILFLLSPYYGLLIARLLLDCGLTSRTGAILTAALTFLVPCAMLGTVTPLLLKVSTENLSHAASQAGNLYAISTTGSIAGTIFTSFFMIAWLGTTRGIQLLSAIIIGSSVFWLNKFRNSH